jgi:hypothetical protein
MSPITGTTVTPLLLTSIWPIDSTAVLVNIWFEGSAAEASIGILPLR